MPKNIVLLSDGTGQRGGAGYETNVWRLYQALEKNSEHQLVCYDDGVGSQRFQLMKALGGATGLGLATNVRELYTFLVRHWQPGDRVYLFGFSRGAFTVRLLADMVHRCGLLDLSRIADEQALFRLAKAAYCACQKSYHSPAFAEHFRSTYSRDEAVPIHFLGVWDTVSAIGIPFAEVRYAVHNLMQYGFQGDILNPGVERACQALSIDDCRKTFHPLVWDERLGNDKDRIEQVWFAGVHSNVGGGYPKRQMALVSLDWMIRQVRAWDAQRIAKQEARLTIDDSEIERIQREMSANGYLYDSRQLFRYQPRELQRIGRDYTKVGIKLHETVFDRIRQVSDLYSPHNLGVHTDAPQLRVKGQSSCITGRWRRAMAAARSVTLLQQVVYYALLFVALAAFFSLVQVDWDDHPSQALAVLVGYAIPFGLLALTLSKLRRWQTQISSAGWSTLFSEGRAPGDNLISRLRNNPLLDLAKSLRTKGIVDILDQAATIALLVVVLVLSPFIYFGRKVHHEWVFRGLESRDEATKPLKTGGETHLSFQTSLTRMRTGLVLEGGKRYLIRVEECHGWYDKGFPATPDGLRNPDRLPAFMRKASDLCVLKGEMPLVLLASIGDLGPIRVGTEATITAGLTGELSLYVNDVFGWLPVVRDFFYMNNRGVARISVKGIPNGS